MRNAETLCKVIQAYEIISMILFLTMLRIFGESTEGGQLDLFFKSMFPTSFQCLTILCTLRSGAFRQYAIVNVLSTFSVYWKIAKR